MTLPFAPPLDPMLAKLTRELPLGDLVYEPKVLEVAYQTIDDRRLRYPARFARLRPDRDARSCRFDQLAPATAMTP